jgi:sulfatase maturation enzyme AslB (radical SAM superfamily)
MKKYDYEHSPSRVLEITTVIGCRVACCYCPQEKFVKAYKKRSDIYRFDIGGFKAVLKNVPEDVDIYFCGMSEPFLNPQCAEMISFAWQKGHRIAVDTCLVGMTEADLKLLKDVPLLFLALHLPSKKREEMIEVDDGYLALLNSILDGALSYKELHLHYYGDELNEKIEIDNALQIPLFSRGGTIQVGGSALPKRARGEIGCIREHKYNVLLPNGDVLLCSTDWEMKHVIGNLYETDYQSLFKSKTFLEVVAGMNDEDFDILCRYCESHVYNKNIKAKILNFSPKIQRKLKFMKAATKSRGKEILKKYLNI